MYAFSHHRAHGIRKDQYLIPTFQRGAEHGYNVGIHERLTTGKSNLGYRPVSGRNLIKVLRNFGFGHVDEAVILRAAFDVAIHAGNVAKRSSIEP